MASAKYVDERKNVMVGNLPDDFLRVSSSNCTSTSPTSNNIPRHPAQYRNFGPNNSASQITISIIQAQLTKNYSLTKMDPYVRIRIGHSVYETHSDIRGGKFPSWNKIITSFLPQGVKTIYIDVFDEKNFTADERIAHAEYTIPEEALQGKFLDTWVPLDGKQGEGKEGSINITVHITPASAYSSIIPTGNPIVVVPPSGVTHMPYYMPAAPVVQYPMMQPMMNPNYSWPPGTQQQRHHQPPCPPPVTEEDIKQLQEMFPSYDKEVIIGVLENCGGNKEQAITSLLNLAEN